MTADSTVQHYSTSAPSQHTDIHDLHTMQSDKKVVEIIMCYKSHHERKNNAAIMTHVNIEAKVPGMPGCPNFCD